MATVSIIVRTLTGQSLPLDAEQSDTVGAVRTAVADALGLHAGTMRLLHLGRDLNDPAATLQQVGLEAGATFTLHALPPAPIASDAGGSGATARPVLLPPAVVPAVVEAPEAALVRVLRAQLATALAERDAARSEVAALQPRVASLSSTLALIASLASAPGSSLSAGSSPARGGAAAALH